MSGSKWVESGMRRQVGFCLEGRSVGQQPQQAALGKSQAHDISAIGALDEHFLWRKNSQRTRKLIDGTSPPETPRCRVGADIDALCDGSEGALTMMQVRIPSGGVLRGTSHTFSS